MGPVVDLVEDPKTGMLVLPEKKDDSGSAAPAKTPLVLTPIPNASNPATYTAAIQLGDVVLAVDDFTFDDYQALTEAETAHLNQCAEAERLVERHRAALATCTDPTESQALRDSIEAANADYDAGTKGKVELWREVAAKHLKGVRAEDGQFYPLAEGEPSPLCTAPALRAFVIVLSRRACHGASEADFLPQR